MTNTTKISEIFTSIQGEGLYIGVKQLFIRFCGCNLHCTYCDTDKEVNENCMNFSVEDLIEYIKKFNLKNIHSVSLTGGEPLLWADFLSEFLPKLKQEFKGKSYLETNSTLKDNLVKIHSVSLTGGEPLLWADFLSEFLPKLKQEFKGKIYLETNSTLKDNLVKIAENIDIISADIKLPSTSGVENSFAIHDGFFNVAKKLNKEIFAKIVFDENISDDEISHCISIGQKYNLPLILQPKTIDDKVSINNEKIMLISDKFLNKYSNTRLIPQTHKFLGIE